jgi:hypothetical protein
LLTCLRYLESLKQKALKGDKIAYKATCSIFKIAEDMCWHHIQNQITFFEMFDEIKDYISNSRKICSVIKRIIANSSFLVKKMVKVTNDVPKNILEMKDEDSFFLNAEPIHTEEVNVSIDGSDSFKSCDSSSNNSIIEESKIDIYMKEQ